MNWYLFSEDLIDGCRFFECKFIDDSWPLFLHIQHEGIQWFLHVGHVITVVTADTTRIIVNVTQVIVAVMATRRITAIALI